MVKHQIPLIPGARLIRQKERRMNPQLQLLVKTEFVVDRIFLISQLSLLLGYKKHKKI